MEVGLGRLFGRPAAQFDGGERVPAAQLLGGVVLAHLARRAAVEVVGVEGAEDDGAQQQRLVDGVAPFAPAAGRRRLDAQRPQPLLYVANPPVHILDVAKFRRIQPPFDNDAAA